MEEQDKLNRPIGTIEPEGKLEPKKVLIVNIKTELVKSGEKQWDVVVFSSKHPDKQELIDLKKIKYEKDNKIKVVGASLNFDKEGNLNKFSALAHLLKFYSCKTLAEMKDKEVSTSLDDKGYLCIRAY